MLVYSAQHLFEHLLDNQTGMLKNVTRVLVTHSVSYLPKVDNIVVLENGRVSETGTYQELLDADQAFAEFLRTYVAQSEEKAEEERSRLDSTMTGEHTLPSRQTSLARQRSSFLGRQTSRVSKKSNIGLTSETAAAELREKEARSRIESSANAGTMATSLAAPAGAKLINVEESAVGNIDWTVYWMYMKYTSLTAGFLAFIVSGCINLFNVLGNCLYSVIFTYILNQAFLTLCVVRTQCGWPIGPTTMLIWAQRAPIRRRSAATA